MKRKQTETQAGYVRSKEAASSDLDYLRRLLATQFGASGKEARACAKLINEWALKGHRTGKLAHFPLNSMPHELQDEIKWTCEKFGSSISEAAGKVLHKAGERMDLEGESE